jgi:hypothetical protein
MSDVPQYPSDVLDRLQLELGAIDRDLESGADPEPEASDDELRLASVIARESRFSRVSGEVVDDLLADEDAIDAGLRERLTIAADRVLEERRLVDGPLEPLLVTRRELMSLDHAALAEAFRAHLSDETELPAPDRLALAEAGRLRFDEFAEGDKGADLVAAWIRTVDLDAAVAVAALERSLPELAGAGFGGGDASRRTNAQQFVKAVAERLGVEYPGH